jgi:hypothetical protein
MSVCFNWEAECSCKTEISQLDISLFVNQQVLRLEISVHYSVGVAVGCSLQDLVAELLDCFCGQWASNSSHVLLQIVIAVLKCQVKVVFLIDHFVQPNLSKLNMVQIIYFYLRYYVWVFYALK